MKNIALFSIIGIMMLIFGCSNDSQKNEVNPIVLLQLLSLNGSSALTVNATYNGTPATDGTGKIYVYLFKTLGITSRGPTYSASSTTAVTIGTKATITVNNIKDGNYYILVFYDYHSGGNSDNQTDRYVLYTDTGYAAAASQYTISGNSELNGIFFDDTYILQSSSLYMTP